MNDESDIRPPARLGRLKRCPPSDRISTEASLKASHIIPSGKIVEADLVLTRNLLCGVSLNAPTVASAPQKVARIRLMARKRLLIDQFEYMRRKRRKAENVTTNPLIDSHNQPSTSSSLHDLKSGISVDTTCKSGENIVEPTNGGIMRDPLSILSNVEVDLTRHSIRPTRKSLNPTCQQSHIKLKVKSRKERRRGVTGQKLPYLKRNWLSREHQDRTRRRDQACQYVVQLLIHPSSLCHGFDPSDIEELSNQLLTFQRSYQRFFLPGGSQSQLSDNLVRDYIWRQIKLWQPRDQDLTQKWAVEVSSSSLFKISLSEKHWVFKLTVHHHRTCLRSRLIESFQQAVPPASQEIPGIDRLSKFDPFSGAAKRVALQRKKLDFMFGNGPEPSTTTIEVRNGLESSVRSKLRQVKVPSGIGALHFQTMEPYREGNLVYDSEDDLPPEQYEWRRYRSGQLCERTSQLSIIKKCNLQIKPKEIGEPEHDARYREWSMAHQLRTLWNQYLHSITTKPSSSPSSILHYPDLVKFIGIYVQCYSPDPTARFELIKFLLCFDFRNPNDFQCDGHDDRSGREHIIDHIHSLLKYYDSTERSKKLHYSRSTS